MKIISELCTIPHNSKMFYSTLYKYMYCVSHFHLSGISLNLVHNCRLIGKNESSSFPKKVRPLFLRSGLSILGEGGCRKMGRGREIVLTEVFMFLREMLSRQLDICSFVPKLAFFFLSYRPRVTNSNTYKELGRKCKGVKQTYAR